MGQLHRCLLARAGDAGQGGGAERSQQFRQGRLAGLERFGYELGALAQQRRADLFHLRLSLAGLQLGAGQCQLG